MANSCFDIPASQVSWRMVLSKNSSGRTSSSHSFSWRSLVAAGSISSLFRHCVLQKEVIANMSQPTIKLWQSNCAVPHPRRGAGPSDVERRHCIGEESKVQICSRWMISILFLSIWLLSIYGKYMAMMLMLWFFSNSWDILASHLTKSLEPFVSQNTTRRARVVKWEASDSGYRR